MTQHPNPEPSNQHVNWRKSTRSQSNAGANCVEVGSNLTSITIRDSTVPHDGTLELAHIDWMRFLDTATGRG